MSVKFINDRSWIRISQSDKNWNCILYLDDTDGEPPCALKLPSQHDDEDQAQKEAKRWLYVFRQVIDRSWEEELRAREAEWEKRYGRLCKELEDIITKEIKRV